jgi:hypothetical protein
MFNKDAGVGNEGLKEFEIKRRVASFEAFYKRLHSPPPHAWGKLNIQLN